MRYGKQSENCSFEDVESIVNAMQLFFHIPTFLLGLFLNLLAIYKFSFYLRKQRKSNKATAIYMINLAIFDLLLVFSLPFKMALSRRLHNTTSFCTMIECLYFVSMYGSVLTITFISFDRYVYIRYPIMARSIRSSRTIFMVCCSIWVLIWLLSIPIYKFHGDVGNSTCFHNISGDAWGFPAILPLEIFGFFLPLIVVSFCGSRSISILRGCQIQGVAKRSIIRSIAASLAVFVASFFPIHLCIFLQFLVRNDFIQDCPTKRGISFALQLALCLSNVNCCLDFFCYYFTIKEFRTEINTDQPATVIPLVSLGNTASQGPPGQGGQDDADVGESPSQ